MTDPAETETALLDLLAQWEESPGVPPTEICAARPDLLETFRRRAARLTVVNRACALAGVGAVSPRPDIPGFDLDGPIGRGGMGVVYRGRDRALDRTVAVKLPVGEYCDPAARRRFEREGRTLARLRHPHIVPIYSAGLAGFTPYLVMDYVPGGHLGGWVTIPRPADRVAEVFEQVCRAVEHAHRAGIVHRDLKPSNVLIDDAGRPLVSDFGVSALFADDRPGEATVTGPAGGTPAYMAPEQRPPGRVPYTAAADVWSLGVMLHELLTGRRPGDPDGPAQPAPAGLLRIARRCLEPDPADRYPSAGAVADAVQAWRRARRNRVRRAVLVGLMLLAGVAAFGIAWLRPEARREREKAAAIARYEKDGKLDLLSAGYDGSPLIEKRYRGAATDVQPKADGLLMSTAADVTVVELLPKVTRSAYTLRAVIEPKVYGNGKLWFGLVGRLGSFTTAAGEQATMTGLFVHLDFADTATEVALEHRWYGAGPGPGNTPARILRPPTRPESRHLFRLPTDRPTPDPWHLTLRITPLGTTAACARPGTGEEMEFGPLTAAHRATLLGNALRKYPDAVPFERAADGVGVGVMVGYGTIAVRTLTLESDDPR